eukprot:362745-Chlamydomonas_euryale.AAC.10
MVIPRGIGLVVMTLAFDISSHDELSKTSNNPGSNPGSPCAFVYPQPRAVHRLVCEARLCFGGPALTLQFSLRASRSPIVKCGGDERSCCRDAK